MAISVRRRGEIWHARGTVRVGREVVAVASVSTGCRRRADAEAWCAAEEARIHDWRHDWAARMVMAGTDLYTLMRLGGWSSLKMVERYASVTADHMAEAVRRIA